MDRYRPEEIIDELNNIDVLQNPESQDFAPNDVESLRDSEHVEVREPNGFYDLIEIDRLNENIFFSFNDRDVAPDFYRAVEFGEDYTLMQSINNRSPTTLEINSNFTDTGDPTVLHYLTKNDKNYLFEEGEYREFRNDFAVRAHKKSQDILKGRPFSGELLEPADD